jgi:ketosteroid isomerase-like protein
MGRRVAFAATLLVALAGMPGVAGAGGSDKPLKPLRVVRQSIEAFNRGDAAKAASYYAIDAEFFTPLGGCDPCVGREVIEQKLGGAIQAQTQVSISRARVSGRTVTADLVLEAPTLPPGVERAVGTLTVLVRKGKAVEWRVDYDRGDAQTAMLLDAVGAPTTGG